MDCLHHVSPMHPQNLINWQAILVLPLTIGLAGCGSRSTSDSVQTEFQHDFRHKPLPAALVPFQVNVDKVVELEPDGLLINIRKPWNPMPNGTGIKTAFGLKGDCQVTVTLEILQTDASTPGNRFGVALSLKSVQGDAKAVTAIERVVESDNTQHVRWWSQYSNQAVEIPSNDKVCRLRLKRTGTEVHYLWAPGTHDEAFQDIGKSEVPDNIEHVRVACFTGGRHVNLAVRLLDIQVIGNLVDPSVIMPPKGRLALALFVCMVITLSLGLALWFFLRWRRRASIADGRSISRPEQQTSA